MNNNSVSLGQVWWILLFFQIPWCYGQSLFEPPITALDNREYTQSGDWNITVGSTGQTFAIWGNGRVDVFNKQSFQSAPPIPYATLVRGFSVAALSPDGQQVALTTHLSGTESWKRGLWLRDLETGSLDSLEIQDFLVHETVEFSPDGSHLAVVSQDIDFHNERLYLFDLIQMKLIATIQLALNNTTRKFHATFSPDWHWLVVSRERGSLNGPEPNVVLWDLMTLQERPLSFRDRSCCGGAKMVFTPDGRRLLIQGGYTVRMYDIQLDQELEAFDTGADVGELTLSSQGNYLAGYSRILGAAVPADYATCIWNWQTRTLIGTMVNETPGVFSPDESLLAFIGNTGSVRVWSVAERREVEILANRESSIKDVAFTPDGTSLVTIDVFGLVQLWKRHLSTSVVETEGQVLPERTYLGTAYPNPANPQAWIPYGLAKEGEVRISIFNIAGQLMSQLDLGRRPAGYYTGQSAAYWDGRDSMGHQVSSGVYIVVLESAAVTATGKLVLLK